MDEKIKENKFVAWTSDPAPCEDALRTSDLAEILKEVMENKEMSQTEVCKKAGITEVSMSRYCTGKRFPNTKVLIKLAEALDVSIDLLVGWKRNMYNEIVMLRKELREAKENLGETILENKALRQYNYNGTSGICRAKLMGDMSGTWHIGNVVCVENGKSFMLMQDGFSEENGYLILRAMEVIPETIQRFACMEDMTGERLFEGDVIYNPEHKTVRMEICYGKYAAYCPNDQEYMETVGFYMVSNTTDDAMPLGPTKKYALLLGNVVDNPEIKVV